MNKMIQKPEHHELLQNLSETFGYDNARQTSDTIVSNQFKTIFLETKAAKHSLTHHSLSHPLFSYQNVFKDDPVAADRFTSNNKTYLRVIAPFLRLKQAHKKKSKDQVEDEKQFSYYLEKRPTMIVNELLSDNADLPELLRETVEVLQKYTKADCSTTYLIDNATNQIYLMVAPNEMNYDRFKVVWDIKEGTTVAASCALRKEVVFIEDLGAQYTEYPQGIGYESELIKSVLCAPIITPDGHCVAVIELYNEMFSKNFSSDAVKIVTMVTGWMGAALHQNQQRVALTHHQDLNDYLLELSKLYFSHHHNILTEKLIREVVNSAKMTLGAERGTFFIIDPESDELVANLFDETEDDEGEVKPATKIRMSKERGIAGLVARTGLTYNIKDAYNDPRFNKDIDMRTGFITRSILCMPIIGHKGVMGVVQLINKKNGPCFTSSDEVLFKTFSIHCSMALHYSHIHTVSQRAENWNKISLQTLLCHHQPCEHDIAYVKPFLAHPVARLPPGFHEFSWYNPEEKVRKLPFYCFYMIQDMFGPDEIHKEHLMHFILLMKKYYRPNPYHNFQHAFNVMHCMYLIINKHPKVFTDPIERQGMLIAALGHDVDHPAYTNSFLALTNHDLSKLYEFSFLEHHHYNITMMLLREAGTIFPKQTPEDIQQFNDEVKESILATDLPSYFKSRALLAAVARSNSFSFKNTEHRTLLKSIIITTCDLSAQCKPFYIAKNITEYLYEEFYHQGDLEKELGKCPLSVMDRQKKNIVPEDQIQFLSAIVIPCAALIKEILPNTEAIHRGACAVKKVWTEEIQHRGVKCWKHVDSFCKVEDDDDS